MSGMNTNKPKVANEPSEKCIDKAVEATFPASDPVALGQGVTPPVADYSRRRRAR